MKRLLFLVLFAAGLMAASERPPMMMGTGSAGAGAMTASSRSKNVPW